MGLDMYLEREYYLYNWYKKNVNEIEITHEKTNNSNNFYTFIIPLDRCKRIILMEHQWRKSNAIHKWFVDHVQEGNDDCGRYWVSIDKLKELKETLDKVLMLHYDNLTTEELEEKCTELLPTQAGFFFGDTTYSEDYFGDIMDTLNTLDRILAEENPIGEFYYSSSW